MQSDKITIVSGEPRSGTSLMMQTLKALGAPVTGSASPQEDRLKHFKDEEGKWLPEYESKKVDIERRIKHSEMMNPVGFYETEFVSSGVRGVEAERFKGKVMKIVTSGIAIRHGNHGTAGTDKKLIDKMILCVRNPKNIAVSQKNLINETVLVAGKNEDEGWVYHNDAPPSPLAYIGRTGGFVSWLKDNPDFIDQILVVEYEDMQADPEGKIKRVAEFLEIEPTAEQMEAAISNVNPSLKRSDAFDEWPEQFKDDGELAMQIYEAAHSLDLDKIELVKALLDSRQERFMLEHSRWIDNEFGTWVNMGADLYRSVANNKNNVRDNLLKRASNPEHCQHFSESEEKYTIRRPVDIGDLERNMVKCGRSGDCNTLEQCYHCWSFGSMFNGQHVGPQRN